LNTMPIRFFPSGPRDSLTCSLEAMPRAIT
jgi:hypothetical protein